MSGDILHKYWILGEYQYPYYRFIVEYLCHQNYRPHSLILDAGCGPNSCSLSSIKNDVEVVCIDISSFNIESSYKRVKIRQKFFQQQKKFHYLLASTESLPFRSNSFDLVISQDVLEHIKANITVVKEIKDVIKKNGHFIGSTSNKLNPVMYIDFILPHYFTKSLSKIITDIHYERHNRFTLKTLTKIFQENNFKIKNLTMMGFPQFKPWLYMFRNQKTPWFTPLWILFDKITNYKLLTIFKEIIIFHVKK